MRNTTCSCEESELKLTPTHVFEQNNTECRQHNTSECLWRKLMPHLWSEPMESDTLMCGGFEL